MSEKMTPIDPNTGLPLPIIPDLELFNLDKDLVSWHHHFHPSENPIFETTGGLALRSARLQLINNNVHNKSPNRYHHFFDGPPIPYDESTQFRLCVLAYAGYIPEEGLDLTSGAPIRRSLEAGERKILTTLGDRADRPFRYKSIMGYHEPLRRFFGDYVLGQDLDHIEENDIEEFLESKDKDRIRTLGHSLLDQAAEVASEVLKPIYLEARTSEKLHPHAPERPHDFVLDRMGSSSMQREKLIRPLRRILRVRYDIDSTLQTGVDEVELAA
jgi:hypothetical protein